MSYSGTSKTKQDGIFKIIESGCCSTDCLKSLPFNDIDNVRKDFSSLETIVDKRNYILSYLKENTSSTSDGNLASKMTVYRIKGTPICKQAWLKVHGIRQRRFEKIHADFKNGSEMYTHGNSRLKRLSIKTTECVAWLTFLVNSIGDQQPDSGKIHLPSCFTKLALYEKMSNELSNEDMVSRSHFYSIMEKKFKHVSIPKVPYRMQFSSTKSLFW